MKKTLIAISLAATAGLSTSAIADDVRWNLVELGYAQVDVDDTDIDAKGALISGSFLLNPNIFIAGSYSATSDDVFGLDVDVNQASLGLGYRYPLANNIDAYGIVSYEDVELETDGGDADGDGYGLSAGLRMMANSQIELDGKIVYKDIEDDSDTGLGLGATYYFNANIGAGINYITYGDFDQIGANLRWAF